MHIVDNIKINFNKESLDLRGESKNTTKY